MRADLPYFMTNEEWYEYDLDKGICVLTEAGKAIPEVVKSYEEFYSKPIDEPVELPPAKP